MELGRADRARHLQSDGRAEIDVLDAATHTDRPQVENDLEVFAREHNTEFGIRTTSGLTPFRYRDRFASDGPDTVVHLDASVELPGATAVLGPLAARGVKRGVDANLAALKRTLEASSRHAQSATA